MKILQVTAVDFTLKKFLLPLIAALKNEGYIVEIACNSGEIGEELKKEGYKIHHIPFSRNINVVSHLMNLFRLVRLIRKEKYQCLHAHTPVAGIIARLAGRIAGVPVILYTAHGFYFHEHMNPITFKIAYSIEKIWCRYFTDYLFFQSKEDYAMAVSKKFNRADQILYIGNGVSPELFNPSLYDRDTLRNIMGLSGDDIVLIFVGRIVREKGITELFQAYKNIKGKHPKVKLLLVGDSVEGDRDSVNINELLNEMPQATKKDIFVLGLRNDVPQLLSMADIFILPSYREGLPRSIIEAMAMNKPIIATNIRGCREEVYPGVNGYLCKVKDTYDLTHKLLMLLQEPEIINRFGEKSRELFLKEFDERKVLEKQLHVFRKITGEIKHV